MEEDKEIKEFGEMKETRKTEEMEEIGETESEESEDETANPGKCIKCHQNNSGRNWCHPCNSKQFQNKFDKWTSEDREIDKFIQQMQLSANKYQEIIEWIPFERLENVTYLAKGGFGTVYKANWLDGFIKSYKKRKWYEFGKQVVWNRYGKQDVCLKSLSNFTNKNYFLQEIKNQLKFRGKNSIAIYGITKNPTENEYMMVMNYAEYGSLRKMLNNKEIDKFIQQMQLSANKYQEIIEWIPFERLENVTYLAKGGFGTVYKANWLDGFIKSYKKRKWYEFGKQVVWNRYGKQDVCLKSLSNFTNKNYFLQEIKNQLKFRGKNSIAIYGITKNPTENEYMMVMNYAEYGSLRKMLNNKFKELSWKSKSLILLFIVKGLKNIHEMGLMHKDFHPGNVVNQSVHLCYITDFGLCKPVSEKNSEKIFGIIPYMAPETLSRGEYTQASDIYSFGMIMLEVLTSYPPYYNIPHNENLAMGICEGLKPEIKYEIPQFLKEIMEKCWNFDPLNRPTTEELEFQLHKYLDNGEIRKQIKVANKSNKNFIQYDSNVMHPEAIYTSRYLPFLKLKKFEDNPHETTQWSFFEENEIHEN
ncbi:hypothetical protein Glove_168g245 [Diversispora epigaea]|uniref:Protein kinase domain-containing protein n=1 Tax=Diversispora epigaea TaxID=1348612 RepID=A0A397IZ70_9GLOM|nr:hypothetical protein Glove_168g245 [Diversispora epigaea]